MGGDIALREARRLGVENAEQQNEPRSLERRRLIAVRRAGAVGQARGGVQPDRYRRVDRQREGERPANGVPSHQQPMAAVIVVGDEMLFIRPPRANSDRVQVIQ